MTIRKLSGAIQNYAWGSRSMLAEFQGRVTPAALPEAELWFGAHPLAPSTLEVDAVGHKLDAYLQDHAQSQLGDATLSQFGKLPFLLKVLAVDQPLSIQLHPNQEQAEQGYRRERSLGIAADDPRANYRDAWSKPELLCPLTDFEALCGFRPVAELIELFGALGGDCFKSAEAILKACPNDQGLRQVTATWLGATGSTKTALFDAAIAAFRRYIARSETQDQKSAFVLDLARRSPGDMGVFVALLLHHLHLSPGVGLFVKAGVLHAYLRGFAVEVMANSDNVLRGGLTPKHVDVQELLAIANFKSDLPLIVTPEARGPLEKCYTTHTPQFKVSQVGLEKHTAWCADRRSGPEMLLCVSGALCVVAANSQEISLTRGQCVWVSADENIYCVSGEGSAFRVQVGP